MDGIECMSHDISERTMIGACESGFGDNPMFGNAPDGAKCTREGMGRLGMSENHSTALLFYHEACERSEPFFPWFSKEKKASS